MRKLAVILGLATIALYPSCEKPTIIGETASLKLEIKAYFGGEELEFGKQYPFNEDASISIDNFVFYMSDVGISDNSTGSETELFEIGFVDFGSTDAPSSILSLPFKRVISNIPIGSYSKINLGIGVNSEYNLTTPSDYSSTHSLGRSDYYSNELNSYIFSRITGKFDIDGDQILDRSIGIQAGSNALYQKVTIPIQLNLSNNETGVLTFGVDIKKLFEQENGELVNITEIPEMQEATDASTASLFMNRFHSAISLE